MAKAERLILADYNGLDNKPIINANLNDVTLVPVVNTYYRHTGTTTLTYKQGIIYKYDGIKFEEIGAQKPIDLSSYIQADTLEGLLPNVKYALVHDEANVFTLVEAEDPGTGWLIATTDEEVEELLIEDNIGKFFMFIGTSETYLNYSLYQIIVDDDTITPALVFFSAESVADALEDIRDDIGDLETALEGKQDTLESGETIKTINGQSVLGSGNIAIKTYQPFPAGWTVNGTVDEFCADVNADTSAIGGMAYLGDVIFSDLPFNGNADAVVEIIRGTSVGGKVIHIVITSGDRAPYRWEYTWWNNGLSTSGWKSWQETLVGSGQGQNIKTINNTNILGSGNIQIDGVTDYDDLDNIPIINADLASQEFVAVDGKYYRHTGVTGATFIAGMIYYAHNGAFIPITKDEDTNNYNLLSNIPVINQDLGAVGFVPVAGKYYRHVEGATPSVDFVDGTIYFYNGSAFKKILVDGDLDTALNSKADASDVELALAGKQDTLESGVNIKTINNESILGEGNIEIQGGGTDDYDELENTPIINQHETVDVEFVPFATNMVIHNGDKMHIDKTYTQALETLMADLKASPTAFANMPVAPFFSIMFNNTGVAVTILDAEWENEGQKAYGPDAHGMLLTAGRGDILYATEAGAVVNPETQESIPYSQGWNAAVVIDNEYTFNLTEIDPTATEGEVFVDDSVVDPQDWNGTLLSAESEIRGIEPTPVNGKYYKRPDGDFYKYTEEITPAHLDALTIEQVITDGTKIHFDTTKTPEEMLAFFQGLDYQGESDRFAMLLDSTNNGFVIVASEEVVAENVPYILMVGDEDGDHIVYTTGAIPDSEITEAGWHNLENGDLTLSMNEDDTISEINDTDPASWNGVICGIFVEETETKTYDKVVLHSELSEGGGLPDSTNAKDGDALRVKITPEEVAFLHPVELVTAGTTNDIFINTSSDIDLSKFSLDENIHGMGVGKSLIRGDIRPISSEYGVSYEDYIYLSCSSDDQSKDMFGNDIASQLSTFWTYVQTNDSISTDANGFNYVKMMSLVDSQDTTLPLLLYKFDDNGTSVWAIYSQIDVSSQGDYGKYSSDRSSLTWSSASYQLTDPDSGDTYYINQGLNNSISVYLNKESELAYNSSILTNLILAFAGTKFDIAVVSYEGELNMLGTLVTESYASDRYQFDETTIIYLSDPLGDLQSGWSMYLEYAQGSHENGIISYLRGFIPMILTQGRPVDGLITDITYVLADDYAQQFFGSQRDVGVITPAVKEIGWGLPYPEIKKDGQVLKSACDTYNWVYDGQDMTIVNGDRIYFNTSLDLSDADNIVKVLAQASIESPVGVMIYPDYVLYGLTWSMAVPVEDFAVGMSLGEYSGYVIDASKATELASMLNSLGLTSGSSPAVLLSVSSDGETTTDAITAEFIDDQGEGDYIALKVAGQEIFRSIDSEVNYQYVAGPVCEGECVVTAVNHLTGLIYEMSESEDNMQGLMLGVVADYNTDDSSLYKLYSTYEGKVLVVLEMGDSPVFEVSEVSHGWNEDNFQYMTWSGTAIKYVSSDWQGAEAFYGKLASLQNGVFYGDVANPRVEWGEAGGKVNPEDYETSSPYELYYLMGEGHQGEDLKRYNYSDVKSDISDYIQQQITVPQFYNGTLYVDQYNWSNQGTYYSKTVTFDYTLDSNDTLMLAPYSLQDATIAQEANVYFAGHDNYSSSITFYASSEPENAITFSYSLIQRN